MSVSLAFKRLRIVMSLRLAWTIAQDPVPQKEVGRKRGEERRALRTKPTAFSRLYPQLGTAPVGSGVAVVRVCVFYLPTENSKAP